MAASLAHRGPDGEGILEDGELGLAHRRLSIIDLEGGGQPMSTADGLVSIVYNGEVFNYVELFDELRALGHQTHTQSDTEVILLAYRQWGLDFPSHLNGMFAMAIWDRALRRLVLCRDRMGVKPLYYAETPEGVAFASEVKALRGVPGVDTTLDPEAVDEYLTLGYVLDPRCMERGIRKLHPGTITTIDAAHGPTSRTYWSLRFEPDDTVDESQWTEQIRALFDDAVRIRLRSDVPVGVLLSGGVDSAAIASAAAYQRASGSAALHSFCVGVDLPQAITEFSAASALAAQLGTQHHEVRLTERHHNDALLDAASMLDQPLAEPMVAQLLAVCRYARRYVTVLLSGEGADETWFGYTAYRTARAIELARGAVPAAVLRRLEPLLGRTADMAPTSRVGKILRLMSEPLERRYLGLNHFDTGVKDRMLSAGLREVLNGRDSRESVRALYDEAGGTELASRMAAVDCRAWLVDNTLARSDIMSMAASVELRVPFMDYRLVELALRVPERFKVEPFDQKVIFKRAIADRLPPGTAKRAKLGFPTPVAALLRSSLGDVVMDLLASPSSPTRDLLDAAEIARLLREHREGLRDWSRQLLQVLMLGLWAQHAARTDAMLVERELAANGACA